MISVVVPTLNAAASLPKCLTALVPAVVEGVVREVILADGGSKDSTTAIGDDAGCVVVDCKKVGRGGQLREGVAAARHPWILVLHADTVLADGWWREADAFITSIEQGERPEAAAAFTFALDDPSFKGRLLTASVALRCALFKLPYGDQGLLLPRRLYESLGGYPDIPLMEDVALMSRLPRGRRAMLAAKAVTSATRYRQDGYALRIGRNALCLTLYFCGVSPSTIARLYQGAARSS